MSWIKTISPEEATGKLKEIYERVKTTLEFQMTLNIKMIQ